MNRSAVLSTHTPDAHRGIRMTLACMMVLVLYAGVMVAQIPAGTASSAGDSRITATHVLGLEGVPDNAKGMLSVQNNGVQFHKGNSLAAQISIDAIQDLSVGESDKQVGGVPMQLGKMAAPYGGGRVISLFAHMKYDTLTLDYLDANGGSHGAIFQLEKGRGQVLRNELLAKGAHFTLVADQAAPQSTSEVKSERPSTPVLAAANSPAPAEWSAQVDKVDPGEVNIEPAFRTAIYENLLREVAKTNRFKQVFRDGDRHASDVTSLLILKTKIEKYTAGSETRRAVTTVSGATKLTVRSQLCTRDGHVVMERVIAGNVRFMGGNLRATHNLARNVANNIRRSALPQIPVPVPAKSTESAISQAGSLDD